MVKISIIVPCYNTKLYIEQCMRSLMQQTLKDIEIICIDGSSNDGSYEILKQFEREDSRIKIFSKTNEGVSLSRNYGISKAKGKYLMFVDADDCPYPTLVEKLYNKITSDNDLMAVGCHLEYMNSNGGKMNGGIFLGEITKEGFYEKATKEKLIFMQPTAIYDRLLALQVGGHNIMGFPDGKPRYQDLCEDLDLWTRMSDLYKEGKAIVVVPEVLCRYRKHEQALSANSLGMILRMRHIKTNLKRRRRGERELTFIEFRDSISKEELKRLEKEAKSADCLRNAYYCLKKGKLISFIKYFSVSIACNPGYLVDKVKHNLLKIK